MRHGELLGDSLAAHLLLDRLEPCTCGHAQEEHDEDDCCYRCDCGLFQYDWPIDKEGNL